MSFYQPKRTGGPPSYNSAMGSGPPFQKQGRSMHVTVNLSANQYVEVRLNANSPWIVGLVLAVLTVAEKSFGVEYEIRYQAGGRTLTSVFPANSPNIRLPQ